MPEPPSGRQYEIWHGEQSAVAVEVGGGLRCYRQAGFDVLDGYPEDAVCDGARGQPLLPWPNRIRDCRYRFRGVEHQLPLNEPARGTAIHGLLQTQSWAATAWAADRVTLETVLHPRPGYPFTLAAAIEYRLGPEGLEVTMRARNAGPEPLPFGAGQHPYLRAGPGLVDEATLTSPARTRLLTDERGIPTGNRVPVGGAFDLRRPERLGERHLDAAFTDLERSAGGRAEVVLRGSAREVTVWMDAAFGYLMLYTGDALGAAHRRRGLAVEPMTCPPNAFQSGESVLTLEPGETFSAGWGISSRSPTPSY